MRICNTDTIKHIKTKRKVYLHVITLKIVVVHQKHIECSVIADKRFTKQVKMAELGI
jgi:hypothetical protein